MSGLGIISLWFQVKKWLPSWYLFCLCCLKTVLSCFLDYFLEGKENHHVETQEKKRNMLLWNWRLGKHCWCSWQLDHGEYQPHITIAWGEAPDLASIEPYRGKIMLGPEIFAEVDENWKAKVLA